MNRTTVETLIEDPLAAVICDDHPLAEHHRIAPALLADEPILLWTRSAAPTTYGDVVELFSPTQGPAASRRRNPADTNDSGPSGLGGRDRAVAHLVHQSAPSRRAFRPLREPLPYRPLALAWRSDNQSPSLMRFIEVARSTSTYYLNDLAQRYPQLRPEQTP